MWLGLTVGLAAGGPASIGQAQAIDRPDVAVEEQVTRWPSRLCPDDARTSSDSPMRNAERWTLRELFGITPGSMVIQYRSQDWNGPEEVASLAREILEARPRFVSPYVNWAEGADLRRHGFVASIRMPGGATARLAVAGYQVCLRDAKGNYWYFRNVPLDLWPGPGGNR